MSSFFLWIKSKQDKTFFGGWRGTGSFFSILSLLYLLLFVFQNCADPLNLAHQDSASFNSQLPFAFDNEIDTIAYMSCSDLGRDYDPRAYFTFRAGAYGQNSGLKLTKDFLAATKNYTPAQRADSLQASERNNGAILQLSIRQSNDLQSVLSEGSAMEDGKDYSNILAPLDGPVIAERLASLAEGERIRYFSGISGLSGRLLEGSIRFLESESTADSLRGNLRENGLLTVTYTNDEKTNGILARSSDPNDRRKAYGKGYRVDFRLGHGIGLSQTLLTFNRGIQRVINSVQEVDLQGRVRSEANLSTWDCSNEMAFLIVRPEDKDANRVACDRVLDPLTPNETLKALRRVLRTEDWWVDLAHRCVIPKASNGNCYGRPPSPPGGMTQNNLQIKYDGGDCTLPGFQCPHYVSVCVRK